MSKLSIVIPAYNEETHIEAVVHDLHANRPVIMEQTGLADVELIVVNDGSTDQTGEILSRLKREPQSHLKVVTHEVNRGYGAALKTGFRAAEGDFLCFMDADGTVSSESFVSLYREIQAKKADMVVGTRMALDSQMPLIRRVGNFFFASLLSFLSGERVRDSASGVRLFRRELIPLFYSLPDGLHFTPAMSTKAIHERVKIAEIPIAYAERQGSSKLRVVSDGLRFLRIIVGTVLMYNPFKVFLLVGLLFELVAATLLGVPIYTYFSGTPIRFSDYIYRSIGALYFFTSGIQIILFGVLARFIVSTFFKRYETGEWIHRVNRRLRVYELMGVYGCGILGVGIVINAAYFLKYLLSRGLELHWAWLLIAAGFIIVGVQMIITSVVMRILRDIAAAKDAEEGPEPR